VPRAHYRGGSDRIKSQLSTQGKQSALPRNFATLQREALQLTSYFGLSELPTEARCYGDLPVDQADFAD
jgi:hypothetical protein